MQRIDGIEYLDGDEAATLLGVKKATLYAYVSRGTLQSYRQNVGRNRLYRRAEVEALRTIRPNDAPEEVSIHIDDDTVLRDVSLPDAASWAGEH